jgi:MFS family permease
MLAMSALPLSPSPIAAPRPLAIKPLAAAVFAANLGLTVIFPLVPRLAAEAGPARLGWVFAAYAACLVVSQIVAGVLADRLGAARVLVGALTLYASTLFGFALFRGLWGVLAMRALEGLAVGAVFPAVMALVVAGAPLERRGRVMGTIMGLGGIGFLIGPVLGERLARFGLAWPFVAAGCIALGAMGAIAYAAARDTLGDAAKPEQGGEPLGTLMRAEVAGLAQRLTTPAFWGLVLPLIAVKANFSTLQAGLPLIGRDVLHVTPAEVGWLFVLTAAAYGLVSPLAGRLADRLLARHLAEATLALLAINLVVLSALTQFGPFVAAFAPLSLLQSAGYLFASKALADGLGDAARGRGLGLASAIGDLGMVGGPLLLLPLMAQVPWGSLAGAAVVAVVAIPVARLLGRRPFQA